MGVGERLLVVTADDFGIGPEVTRGILELARAGAITASVLLVNSPHAEEAVRIWQRELPEFEVGWHPCLTMDRPVLAADQVPTLVRADGRFRKLGSLMLALWTHRIAQSELEAELSAQLDRYIELVGRPPTVVNGHHHIHIFPQVREALAEVLIRRAPLAYIRRVREMRETIADVNDSRMKRRFLSAIGGGAACTKAWEGFPGNEYLVGLANPANAHRADFFLRWLDELPAGVTELACHPGYADPSLFGRDAKTGDIATIERRSAELNLLLDASFQRKLHDNGIRLVTPSRLDEPMRQSFLQAVRHAA